MNDLGNTPVTPEEHAFQMNRDVLYCGVRMSYRQARRFERLEFERPVIKADRHECEVIQRMSEAYRANA